MDRAIVYPGSIPLDTDILSAQLVAMKAIGAMMASTFGTSTFADGLVCTQTVVPSMSVLVGQGWMGSLSTVDATAFGSLPIDASPLMKMGINLGATTTSAMVAPVTAGQSVVYLVQAAYQEVDGTPVVLPYYNSSTPSVPYTGPANSGTAQNTKRVQSVNIQLKAGSAATTGSQSAPAADTGFFGLYTITIANGQTTITTSNIGFASGAPFLNPVAGLGIKPGRLIGVRTFLSSITYIPTVGTNRVIVEVQGAGGGGGACVATNSSQVAVAGGGSGGTWAVTPIITSGFSGVTITVGAGGAGGVAGAYSGITGGTSSFGGIISCAGGVPGAGGNAGPFAQIAVISSAVPAYPVGLVNEFGIGGPSGTYYLITATSLVSGAGGNAGSGRSGAASVSGNFPGTASPNLGGGGSGGCNFPSGATQVGGMGAPGYVTVFEYS